MAEFREILSMKEEINLLNQIKGGDVDAKKTLLNKCHALVESVAKSYSSNDMGISVDELIEVGFIGIRKALDNYLMKDYQPEGRFLFSAYATWWIKKAICDKLGIKEEL